MQLINLDLIASLDKNTGNTDKAAMMGHTPKSMEGAAVVAEICEGLAKGASIHFYTNGAWSMHELLISLCGITGSCEAFIATYAMSETSARVFSQLKDNGIITRLHCLIDNRTDTRSAGSLQLLQSISDSCVLTACHAKVTLLIGTHASVVVTGSANYTENNRLECGFVTTDTSACNFYKEWISKALTNG